VKGHALTLSLMGRFLSLAFDPPDIARRDCFGFEEADHETSTVKAGRGHAFRVFAAYEKWLEREGRDVEVAILRLLGLFDRPATPDCLAALCAEPLPGLSEPLVGLGERQWTAALKRLRDLDLIETSEWQPVQVTGYSEEDAKAVWEAAQRHKGKDIGPPQPFALVPQPSSLRLSVDAHPLLREYFAWQLSELGVSMSAQLRLYEHLCASVPYWPEGRDGLLPLYQAVAHGCQAGRFEEVRAAVYRDRIKRGTAGSHAAYSTTKLGLLGLDLAAVACFFVEPWSRLASELTPADQAWLLSEAAFRLRALNRLAEAREPMRTGMKSEEKREDWPNASRSAGTLSELELTLGDVPAAESTAAQSVTFADRSDDAFMRMANRTAHADTLHHAGKRDASRTLFAEAEALQAEMQPGYPLLYSLQGYQYCDLLLAPAERAAWQTLECGALSPLWIDGFAVFPSAAESGPNADGGSDAEDGGKKEESGKAANESGDKSPHSKDLHAIEHRATQTLEWVTPQNWLLDIALDHLTLGRVSLLRAVLDSPARHLPQARTALDTALATLRQSNANHHLPRALLPSAWLHALSGDWAMSVQRLNETFALATRGGNPDAQWQGGMRLHLIDTLLHRVRLFGLRQEPDGTPTPYPWPDRTPQQDLAEAADLIQTCGYHRRDDELRDLSFVIGQ
jgi:hypothetical protein